MFDLAIVRVVRASGAGGQVVYVPFIFLCAGVLVRACKGGLFLSLYNKKTFYFWKVPSFKLKQRLFF